LQEVSAKTLPRQFGQVDLDRIGQARQRIEPRQAQQLLEHARRAVGAGHDLPQRVLAVVGVGAELGDLRLDLDHRQRRAQFVRRVGGKAALVFQRVAQPEKQPIEGCNQRLCFERSQLRLASGLRFSGEREATSAARSSSGLSARRTE
jgi:hypothetical protein